MRPRQPLRAESLIAVISLLLVVTTPTATAQEDVGDYPSHILQPAETLLDIALFYNVPLAALIEVNSITDAATIPWGTPLLIPIDHNESQPASATSASTFATEDTATTETTTIYTVQRGDTLLRIALRFNVSMSALVAANSLPNADRIYTGQQLIIPAGGDSLSSSSASSGRDTDEETTISDDTDAVPPSAGGDAPVPTIIDGKQIIVVLSQQYTYAYENGVMVRQFVVSTGLPGTPTVRGNFAIYLKVPSQRMTGPGYDLPNVPWVMYFYRGYSLHGTYWHNNFGFPMSHGCVNMRTPEAEWLYSWAPIGTAVWVTESPYGAQ